MLIEIWEWLRGYRRWNETEGVIESAEIHREPLGDRGILFITTSADTLAWHDQSGQKHSAKLVLPEKSPLFSLKEGDEVTIRYDPAYPDRFYLRELFRTRIKTLFVNILIGICIALAGLVYILYHLERIRIRHQTPRLW